MHLLFFLLNFVIQSTLKMNKAKYKEDLREIRDIMSRTTQFISLSGLSGVSTGVVALLGVFIAYLTIFKGHDYLTHEAIKLEGDSLFLLLIIAVGTLALSIISAVYFTRRKAKSKQQNVWDIQSKRLLVNLLIPLISGGLLCLMLLFKGLIGMLPSITLIFYGLALVNGSKYTLPELRNLGIVQIVLGLLAFQFITYGLLFWALGFGVIQIIYGLAIQKKY